MTPTRPIHLEDEDALDALVATEAVVLVEFYTEGCSICQGMEPVLGVVARDIDGTVALVNPRDDPPLVDRFAVQSVPLFVCFVAGEPGARRAEGFISASDLVSWVGSQTKKAE